MRTVTGHRPDPDLESAIEAILEEGKPTALGQSAERGGGTGLVLPLSIASSTFGALLIEEAAIDVTDETEIQFATEIARRMARSLENGRLYREKAYVARTLQASLLPPTLPEIPGIELAALFLPALHDFEVGGDFYDVFQTEDGAWAAAVGDVCGKGVEAAALTGLARHTLHALAAVETPSDVLTRLNRTMLREQLDGRFCTVAFTRIEPLDVGGARIRLSLGGHPMPLHIAPDGAATPVGEPGTLLGVTDDVRLKDSEVFLEPGESLLLFTDGILRKSEATGGEPHGPATIFRGQPPASAFEASEQVRRYVADHIGDGQYDDIAVLVIRAREREVPRP
jgi:serine phosphatase RsbU (regulator of sigma subunit)